MPSIRWSMIGQIVLTSSNRLASEGWVEKEVNLKDTGYLQSFLKACNLGVEIHFKEFY